MTPRYLVEIPTTGIGIRPHYQHVVGEAWQYDGNPWAILVTPPCQTGFDSLMYFPLQNYPKTGYGGVSSVSGRGGTSTSEPNRPVRGTEYRRTLPCAD